MVYEKNGAGDSVWRDRYGASSASSAIRIDFVTEIYMTQDKSPGYRDTWAFLDRRLKDVKEVGSIVKGVGNYASFTAHATLNILRSKSILK